MVYYLNESFNKDTAETKRILRIIDDKGIDNPSLGMRRLLVKQTDNIKLFNIKVAIYFLGDLVKSKPCWYIDSRGRIFNYKKTTRAKLVCRKIEKIISTNTSGNIIQVQGLFTRFSTLFRVPTDSRYAGILEFNNGFIFYGVYNEPFKNTWRMV